MRYRVHLHTHRLSFLDHEQQFKSKQDVKDISHFLSLPTGQLMPGAAEALYKIKRPKSAETLRRAKIVRLRGTCLYPSLNGRTRCTRLTLYRSADTNV